MDRTEQGIVVLATLAFIVFVLFFFLCGCQQVPYRDIVYYGDPQQPDCDVILHDGFDQTCIQMEIQVEVREVKESVVREVEVPVVHKPTIYQIRISIPEIVSNDSVDFEKDGMSGTVTVEDEVVKVETPTEDIYTPVEDEVVVEIPQTDPHQPNVPVSRPQGNYCVSIRNANDSLQSSVTHSDYLHIDGLDVTWTGSDGEVDPGDTTRKVLGVECGYTYERASERARTIFDDFR